MGGRGGHDIPETEARVEEDGVDPLPPPYRASGITALNIQSRPTSRPDRRGLRWQIGQGNTIHGDDYVRRGRGARGAVSHHLRHSNLSSAQPKESLRAKSTMDLGTFCAQTWHGARASSSTYQASLAHMNGSPPWAGARHNGWIGISMQEYPGALGELCRATKYSELDPARFALGIERGRAGAKYWDKQEQSTVSPRSSVAWISRAHLATSPVTPRAPCAPRRSRRARRNRICSSSHATCCH